MISPLEPESGGLDFTESRYSTNAEESLISSGQQSSVNARRWSRTKDTSKGTGVFAGGIELTEQNVSRFWKHFLRNIVTGCLEWNGALFDGYGRFVVGRTTDGTKRNYNFQAHKLAYTLTRGPLSPTECVAHGLRHSSQDDHGDLVGGQYARTPEAIRALASDAMLRGLSRRLPSPSAITTEVTP